jgi:thiol-disulfide isomerase/thioredoxin
MLCWRPVQAQQSVSPIRPLSIGDTMPDITIPNVLNYTTTSAKLSGFHGKLLILDFWATWCAPCISMIPRMDSLSRQFKDDVVFLPVTYQDANQVKAFREKYTKRTGLRIKEPEVVSDTTLKSLFAHNAVPHYVWIASDRRIMAITGSEDINQEKIAAFLGGTSTAFSKKTDAVSLGYSALNGSLIDFLGQTKLNPNTYRTFYSPHIAGLRSQAILKTEESSQPWRITFTNVLPLSFYKYAYGEGRRFFSMNTIELQTKDSLNFHNSFNGAKLREWIPLHTYCYELVAPGPMQPRAFDILRNDLNRLLPQYSAKVEKRERKVLALIRTSDLDKIKSKTDRFSEQYDKFSYQVTAKSLSDFVTGLNGIYMHGSKHPIVDKTGYTGLIDLNLDVNFSQLDDVNRGLALYDLKLSEQTDNIDILVISDRQVSDQ